MREYYKEKLRTLVALRTNLFACIIVLTGGIFGLFYSSIELYKLLIFEILGGYFDLLFLSNLISVDNDISRCLEELK